MYKINDIMAEFTNKVTEYIVKGYRFSTTMSGHQGEKAKVDLENGIETVRVRLERFDDYDIYNGLEIIVEAFDTVVVGDFHTLWSGRGTERYRKQYYLINRRSTSSTYIDSKEEVLKYWQLHVDRMRNRRVQEANYKYIDTQMTRRIAYSWASKQKGFKTIKPKDVCAVKRMTTSNGAVKYEITIMKKNGMKCQLYLRAA